MTHYQKLAIMIFRVIGLFFLFFGGITVVYALIFTLVEIRIAVNAIFYALPAIIFAIIFFSLSRKLASWVCFDFDKFND